MSVRNGIFMILVTLITFCNNKKQQLVDETTKISFSNRQIMVNNKQLKAVNQLVSGAKKFFEDNIDTRNFNLSVDDKGYVVDLSITSMPIEGFLEQIGKLNSLQSLRLNSLRINNLNKLSRLDNLKNLVLFYCEGLDQNLQIPHNLAGLKRFVIKTTSHSEIKKIVFPKGCQIHTLTIENTNMTSLDKSLEYLENLQLLHLAGNKLDKLTLDKSKFKKLKLIALQGNPIGNIKLLRKKYAHIDIKY